MKLPRMGSRGQQWAVMKLLQGGIIAVTMLVIVYGVVSMVWGEAPESSVYFVSSDLLSSAYAARGTGTYFVRDALLVEEEFTVDALVQKSGLPMTVDVDLFCRKGFCLQDGEPVTEVNKCSSIHSPCSHMEFLSGKKIPVCVICGEDECDVWFGEVDCPPSAP